MPRTPAAARSVRWRAPHSRSTITAQWRFAPLSYDARCARRFTPSNQKSWLRPCKHPLKFPLVHHFAFMFGSFSLLPIPGDLRLLNYSYPDPVIMFICFTNDKAGSNSHTPQKLMHTFTTTIIAGYYLLAIHI